MKRQRRGRIPAWVNGPGSPGNKVPGLKTRRMEKNLRCAGLSALNPFPSMPWAVGPGWYACGPLALTRNVRISLRIGMKDCPGTYTARSVAAGKQVPSPCKGAVNQPRASEAPPWVRKKESSCPVRALGNIANYLFQFFPAPLQGAPIFLWVPRAVLRSALS